jgi:radical SAM/Cys-rich protein
MTNAIQEPIDQLGQLKRGALKTLQINVGKLCHQRCTHCHVDAGPDSKEIMGLEVMAQIVSFLKNNPVDRIDITGGAPELNPNFEYLIEHLRCFSKQLLLRTNLTVIFEPNQDYLPEFYKTYKLELIGSLPCYLAQNVDKQRGNGVFAKSIRALKILNELGYGREGSGLILNLVYNPLGPSLPPPQDKLELDYKREMFARYGIVFNRLYTLTNIPINRFKVCLQTQGQYYYYMELLKSNFNPATVSKLMCLEQVSVGWDGRLYDCDFNQMLNLGLSKGRPLYIDQASAQQLIGLNIKVGSHCYGCVAGGGSSCTGSLA